MGSFCHNFTPLDFIWEGLAEAVILKSGNLPAMIVQEEIPDHEQLIVLIYYFSHFDAASRVFSFWGGEACL